MRKWLICILAIMKDLPLLRGSLSFYSIFACLSINLRSTFLFHLSAHLWLWWLLYCLVIDMFIYSSLDHPSTRELTSCFIIYLSTASCPVLYCLLFLFSLMQPISLALSLSTIFILLSLLSFQFPLRSPPPLPLHPFCPPSLLYPLLDFSIIFLYYITFSSPSPHLSTSYLCLLVYYFICFLLRFWTESYAMPREEVAGNEAHPAVRRLVEMGFAEEDCRQALLTHKGNAFRFLEAFISALFFS